MKSVRRKLLVFILCFCLGASPVTVYANQATSRHLGYLLATAFEVIAEHYIGEVDLEELFLSALSGMTDLLDEYSYFMPPGDAFSFSDGLSATRMLFGLSLLTDPDGRIVVYEAHEGSSAMDAGVMPGDIIVSLNSESVADATMSQVGDMLNRVPPGRILRAEFLRDDETFTVELVRREFPNPSVFTYRLDELLDRAEADDTLRLVRLSFIGENTAYELREVIDGLVEEGVEKIILDLRGNGGGIFDTALDICRMLVSRGPILMLRNNAGLLTVYHSALDEVPFAEIVVLVDRGTASASETIAAALQDRGSTVIGENSFGKTSMQHVFNFNVGYLRITTHENFGPRGMQIEGYGITPDIEVTIPLPELLRYTPGEPDILGVKETLHMLGYFDGYIDDGCDEAAKYAISRFRLSAGLEPGKHIDLELKATLNAYIIRLFTGTDAILEAAYEYVRGSL